MIDSVLKGTGNSRFLKSAVPAGTSWADALAMLQAGTFPIDFNGINTEGFQQVGTPLNKANLLKDATAAQIGLPPSTTPDGMFQALGNTGELHVWRKTAVYNQPVPEVPGSYTLGSATQLTAGRRNTSTSASSYISNLSVSNEISVDLDGNVTLVNPSTVSLRVTRPTSFASDSARTALGGYCYLMATDDTSGEACDMYLPRGQIFYVAENAVYTYAIKEYDSMSSFDAAQLVTGVPGTPAIPAGTTTTCPVSTNPNAWQEGDDAKAAGYTLGEVVTGQFKMASSVYVATNDFYYVDTPNVSTDGVVSVPTENTPKISVGYKTSFDASTLNVLRGKFVLRSGNASCDPIFYSVIYIPADAVFTKSDWDSGDGYTYYLNKYQPVTGYAAIPAGTTIEYLGKLGDKARVQVVSYVGTGTYGSSNPNSLTFDFVPKAILIYRPPNSSSDYYNVTMLMFYGVNVCMTSTYGNGYNHVAWNAKKVSYYSDGFDEQMNKAGQTYYAIAIG